MITQTNSPNKQTITTKDPEFKRLKIFTENYNTKKHKTKFIGLQTESINSQTIKRKTKILNLK